MPEFRPAVESGLLAARVLLAARDRNRREDLEPCTLSYSGHLTITTRKGTLTLIDTGIFDTAAGRFSSLDEQAGGTGVFAGATARLFIYGTGTSDFESKVTGEVCVAG